MLILSIDILMNFKLLKKDVDIKFSKEWLYIYPEEQPSNADHIIKKWSSSQEVT